VQVKRLHVDRFREERRPFRHGHRVGRRVQHAIHTADFDRSNDRRFCGIQQLIVAGAFIRQEDRQHT
jgi:hypothetical protein